MSLKKSLAMSKVSKKRSYGYYRDLCIKYNLDILSKYHFYPRLIIEIEKQQIANKHLNNLN